MLTRFEEARIIGARALQISSGAPVLVKVPGTMTNVVEIVKKELESDVLPISVIRKLPNGKQEFFNLKGVKIEE